MRTARSTVPQPQEALSSMGTPVQDSPRWETPGLAPVAFPEGCGASAQALPAAGRPVGCATRTGVDTDGRQLLGLSHPGEWTGAAPCHLAAPGPVLSCDDAYV